MTVETKDTEIKPEVKPEVKPDSTVVKPEDTPQPGADVVKDALAIARGEKEPPKPADSSVPAAPSATEQKSEEKKEGEQIPDANKEAIEKIRKDYELQLEQERKEKKGIYEDLKKKREQLQQLQHKPPETPPTTPTPANVDTYVTNATTTLKEIGFTDKNIAELKERSIDDPFSVVAAISFAITNHIKDKTLKEVSAADTSVEEKTIVDKEKALVDEINQGWEKTRAEMAKSHPDMIKKGADGKWMIDEKSPKFVIYDEEAKKALQEEPWLINSPRFAALVAQRMEMRLLVDSNFAKGQEAELNRQAEVDGGFVASGGRTPAPKPQINLTSEEIEQADKDIKRGLFKNREEWAAIKNKRSV